MKNVLPFDELSQIIDGELYTDKTHRIIYSTDASSYRELPQAIILPRHREDIRKILAFAREHQTSVIPRGAGTSLAGQVVGAGIVVDISKYMDRILEFNKEEHWIIVEPGVNLAELNIYLKPYGLQFGPETSTSNRCRMGGMLGNNSCGLRSLIYGSVREHVLEVQTLLADGSDVVFGPLSKKEFEDKCESDPAKLETKIYRQIRAVLSNEKMRDKITTVYPESAVKRRNMGYAVDFLMDTDPFTDNGQTFNFSKLLAGSEGTLAFTISVKLNLVPLPPKIKCVVPAHFSSLEEALHANILILKHDPTAVELMDDIIMNCTKESLSQRENRFFIQGEPKAILMIEFAADTREEIEMAHAKMVDELTLAGYGTHFPLIFGDDQIKKVWELRTAGLGLLSNIPGDKRSTTVIEDTAVSPEKLPAYVAEFKTIMEKYGQKCVYYAHIATGELHLRPLLNLKDTEDQKIYASLAQDVAELVKKFRGSLSGEHGDGRLRGSFIPFMFGEEIYSLFKEIKQTWDPWNILNPGKITDVPPITQNLRFELTNRYPDITTSMDFSSTHGYLRAVEQCNGSGDCRKSEIVGGTMCPTYMATRDEDKTTRGRANILREYMHHSEKENPLIQEEIYKVLDLCISCKGCKGECPSNVDMAKIKAEFLQQYYDVNGIPFRARLIAYLPRLGRIAMAMNPITNFFLKQPWINSMIGFHPKRKIPGYSAQSLKRWAAKNAGKPGVKGKVYLFADEFTNYQESEIGIKAILLLNSLGYEVVIPKHRESSRTFLSKGLVREAKKIATDNILLLKDIITSKTPLIGIEPSTILTFRDEYPDLVEDSLREWAIELGKNALLFDEFFVREMEKGNITSAQFKLNKLEIKLHAHCQQKAIASSLSTRRMLAFPENYTVQEVKTGCCGIAGSFGYEKEHYELSMQIGEMVLFPEVRKSAESVIIVAPGTSCRHHIKDGTGKKALHPVEVMYDALLIKI
ncbi:MAG: FAD-linked oxidase C-terminal domain-containing protein [Mariniphaga sp.]